MIRFDDTIKLQLRNVYRYRTVTSNYFFSHTTKYCDFIKIIPLT